MKDLCYKKVDSFFTSGLLFLLCFVVMSLVTASCGSSSKKNTSNDGSQMEAGLIENDGLDERTYESVDIPIAINLTHTEDEEMQQLVNAEYEVTNETDNDIYIDTNSDYYKRYTSGMRFKADKLTTFENSENAEYLTMSLDVVNNTNERLSINELNVIVEESKPDTIPLIYICTTKEYSNCVFFVNESWFNWKGFTFSYSILKKGESFSGKYEKSRHIPFFDKLKIIDLLPEMKDMGYDFEGLVRCIDEHNHNHGWDGTCWDEDNSSTLESFPITIEDPCFSYLQEQFLPFELKEEDNGYVGTATIYGTLEFDNTNLKVDFIAELMLNSEGGFGALSYKNDSFDIKLRSQGNGYTLRYPYTTVLEPYGTEMIKLSITADRSSFHRFHVNIKNDNGLKIRTKDIHFHHYYPKN